MARKYAFKISMIHEGRYQDYHDYWDGNVRKNAKGEELTDGLVGFAIMVDAASMSDAIAEAKRKYPEATVCEKHSHKVG